MNITPRWRSGAVLALASIAAAVAAQQADKYNALPPGSTYMMVQQNLTVEGFEEVTVPAGTFKAFRVRTANNIGERAVNWFSPDLGLFVKGRSERTAEHPAGAGVREMELKSVDVRR